MSTIDDLVNLIKTGDNDRLIEIVNDSPSIVDMKTEQGISLLQLAAYCRNRPAIDIIRKYKKELTIFEAASIADIATIGKLIDQNPDQVNSFSPDGFTALGLASFFGHLEIVKLLLSKNADPNLAANNQFKVAPIHSACAVSNYDITEILIKNGADVNARQMEGVTPLHSAAHNGQTKLVKLLIDNGADINSKMDNGHTPLFMAEEKNFSETAALIKQSGGT